MAGIVVFSTRYRYFPGTPMLLVEAMFTISGVCEPDMVVARTPSPALNPACASIKDKSPNDH